MGTPGQTPVLDDLPEQVRSRVVAMTADVLPAVPHLPATVRRVAAFAPSRRARLGASAITAALADEEFRDRVGVQVAARPAPDAEDRAALAARAWLTRADGWTEEVAAASAALAQAPPAADPELERLRARLAAAEQAVREQRAESREQAAADKAENTTLRRRLGETRAALRAARADLEAAQREAERRADEARTEAEARLGALEKENRRLRSAIERLEAEGMRTRREGRVERDEATVRARLLLDTVIDAAAGLRRELALPPVDGAPADRVEAEVAAAGVRTPSSAGVLGPGSGALLEQLLAMPRARLVIDGYNVTKTAWPTSPLEAQRIRLVGSLAPLVARTGAETTVVFDAAESDHRPPVTAPRGVRVLYSPRGVIADDVIRDLVAAEPTGRVVVVVTGDRALGGDVARAGARVVVPDALLAILAR